MYSDGDEEGFSDEAPGPIHSANAEEERTLSVEAQIAEEDRITLSWTGITVESKVKGVQKVPAKKILTDVQGIVHPGSLMALMGASGAGKTTLLNILNFQNRRGLNISGDIMINGHVVDQKQMSDVSVFVQQADIFVGTLTVKEHLSFHAKLRMLNSTSAEIKQRVEDVMVQMGLKKCENVLIGIPEKIKGVSGGEAKRLAFATEILSKPTLIFCDEPTSGLDTFMARSLVKLLKRYAGVGRTILCTIHQPSSEIFELFDHICIMAEGKCAFIGHSKECMTTFEKAGFACPPQYNPSDHYVFTLAVVPGKEDECRSKVARITEAYRGSNEYEELRQEIDSLMKAPKSDAFKRNIVKPSCGRRFLHFFTQFNQILYRQFKTTLRDPYAFFLRIAVGILMSLIVGFTWFQVDLTKATSQQNIPGCLFYLSTFVAMSSTMLLVVVIPNESPVITRDYLSGVYPIPVYYFAVEFFYTIEVLINTTIIFHIVFWLVFNNTKVDAARAYPGLYATMLLVSLVAIAVGMLISSVASTFSMALSLANPIQTVLMLYAGFLIQASQIPDYFKVFEYISSWYYSLNINMNLIYEDVGAACPVPPLDNKTLDKLEVEMLKTPIDRDEVKHLVGDLCYPKVECDNFMSGQDVLNTFEMEENNQIFRIAMVLLALGIHTIGITVLTVKMWFKRK